VKPIPQRREGDRTGRSRRMRRGAYLLPSLFTTFNIALGYYAIHQTFFGSLSQPWHYDNAARAIGYAVLFDGLDGRIARMTNTTSDFGREFDSLADVITFGVAPAMLAWVWGFAVVGPISGRTMLARIVQLGAVASFAFLIAGASRLARFNIQTNPQPSNPGRPGRKYFVGMPIPAGAGVIAATVHFTNGTPLASWWMALIWAVFVFAASFLMVSTWRFYSFKDLDLRNRHPFWLVVFLGVVIALIRAFSEYVLFIFALGYMLSGVLARLIFNIRRRWNPPPAPGPNSSDGGNQDPVVGYKEASQLQ
jgi:CDP-diacylglycerol--serine O-phosphatidyltransferase